MTTKQPSGYPQDSSPAAPVAGHTPTEECVQWAERNGIYPLIAAAIAFEDAATSEYAKRHSHAAHLARIAELETALCGAASQLEMTGEFLKRRQGLVDLSGGDGPIVGASCRKASKQARSALAQSSSPKNQ